MIIWLYKKYKEKQLIKRIKKDKTKIEIGSGIECTDSTKIVLSDYVYIGPRCKFYGRGIIHVGFNTIIGNDVTILSTNHNYDCTVLPYDENGINKDVYIGDHVWIASNVFILPGITIGDGAVVAGGSVVVKDVPPLAIVGGNPAVVIKKRDEKKYNNAISNKSFYLIKKFGDTMTEKSAEFGRI